MKINEVSAGLKVSKDYNSYQISFTASLDAGDTADVIGMELLGKCYEVLKNKTGIDAREPKTNKEEMIKEEKVKKDDGEWSKCPQCGSNCKIGFNKKYPNKYYCGHCQIAFE